MSNRYDCGADDGKCDVDGVDGKDERCSPYGVGIKVQCYDILDTRIANAIITPIYILSVL